MGTKLEEKFQNFKEGFINANFQNNIYFQPFLKSMQEKYVTKNPRPPKLNVWTSQPVNSIKTMKHL